MRVDGRGQIGIPYDERVKRGADPKRSRSILQLSPAPIRALNSQITSSTSNKLRRAIQTKSTSEKGAVMCDFKCDTNPGWGLSFVAGCCGAPFRQIETVCRGVDDPQLIEAPSGWLLNELYRPPSAQSKEVRQLEWTSSQPPSA